MRAVVQRVSSASVDVGAERVGEIAGGLLVYLGAERGDTPADVAYCASKIAGLRVFEDDEGKMNLDVAATGGAVLVVSQFTLFGDVRRGRRPSFVDAADPADAEALVDAVVAALRDAGLTVATGRFRATMDVRACVAGPVTILIDSRRRF